MGREWVGVGVGGNHAFSPNKHVWKRSSFEVNLLVNSISSIRYKPISRIYMWRCVYMSVCTHTLSLCEIRTPNEFSVFYP